MDLVALLGPEIVIITSPGLCKPANGFCDRPTSADSTSASGTSSGIYIASDPVSEHNSLTISSNAPSPQSSESNKSSKEFKLNPGAKVFCPSFASSVAAPSPAVLTLGGMSYMPSSSPILPFPAPQPEVNIGPFAPRPSVPAKITPYTNLIAGNGGNNSQFSQPIVGHMGSRTLPLRYVGQYHIIPTGPAYVPPNSPPVRKMQISSSMAFLFLITLMVGRLVQQLVYGQPVALFLDVSSPYHYPRTFAFSSHRFHVAKGFTSEHRRYVTNAVRPLIGPHQVPYPKHQGMDICILNTSVYD
ncbi:unnamed protein product [Linum tenue]|uniref:Uncharacterized protein n=1 Tax=Linum tenue TaxID=586396 RepID=A0AAV0H473_9ROSI|nr:unnamed protein product [Linum tenue]